MNAAAKIEAATLHSAMALAFGEIEGATKSANNPHFKTKYADIGAVIGAVKPALINHSLFFTQHCQPSEGGVTVETMLHHAGGESLSLGSLFVPANKNDAQGFGSALTYARRYALVTAFGVPTEDDDGNAARVAGGQRLDSTVSPPPPSFITDAQRTELMQLLDHLNVPIAEVLTIGKIHDLRDLGANRFDGVRQWINNRALELRKEPVS